ncbi:parasitic phase-specific protein psp-1 [Colletotrichum truncatum]|uniref:Parasitic phase-specific protein psp-1 n=1 Tax=Colletotrichum truncatum TaxID=5467 RepID=A0ACC3YJK4_COLTU
MSGPPPPLPPYAINFGPDANCTLEICDIQYSLFKYRPSLPVNALFLALFAIAAIIHIFLGIRWRSWWFMSCIVAGCVLEIIGYVGRILLHNNPFAFVPFMLQIVFITSGPVFYTAAIYVTVSKAITHLAPEVSRIPPNVMYWIFIFLDIACLAIQAAGGAISTTSEGSSDLGVNLAMAGLILQVVIIVGFCAVFADYMIRYKRSRFSRHLTKRENVFFAFLSLAISLILGRCAYRVDELSEGYRDSTKITNEGLFIGLEGVLIIVAVFSLCIGHPGLAFERGQERAGERKQSNWSVESGITSKERPSNATNSAA